MDKNYNTDSTAKNFRSDATKAKDGIIDAANDVSHKVGGFMKSACDNVSNTADSLTSEIRNKPVQSTLIAMGAGFLLSTLLRR